MPTPSKESKASSEAPNMDIKDLDILCTFQIKIESTSSKHWCIKDQWPHPNHDQDAKSQPGASSNLQIPKSRLKGHRCSLHLQNEAQAKIQNIGVSKTSDHVLLKIKMSNLSQEPPASTKPPNENLKDMDGLCTSKIELKSKNLGHWCIKDQWPYPHQDQDPKPQSRTLMFFAPSKSR